MLTPAAFAAGAPSFFRPASTRPASAPRVFSDGLITRTFQVGIQRVPRASFTFQRVGLVVTFVDTSSGSPTSWIWDFGDGTPTSTQQNPVHAYSAPGTYVVTLTVRNAVGVSSASNLVQITN